MTIDDLRERLKKSYTDLRFWYEQNQFNPAHKNMRELWVFAQKYVDDLEQPDVWRVGFREEYHNLIVKFAKDGELYYYAKKHGIKAAVEWRLTKE
jgi:hypothetical protein